jgi:AcrR family transcriptional regulator
VSQLATADRPVQHAAASDAEARRILAAAWTVLERSRFRSLKIRQLLAASDTSASHFYRHFRSKSHLLLALLADETARADLRLSARLAELDSADDQLREWLAFTIRAVDDRRRAERVRLFLDQDLLEELPDEVHLLHDVMGTRLVEIIRLGNAQGCFHSADPVVDGAMTEHLLRGLLANGLMGKLDGSAEEALTAAHRFVSRALGGEPGSGRDGGVET